MSLPAQRLPSWPTFSSSVIAGSSSSTRSAAGSAVSCQGGRCAVRSRRQKFSGNSSDGRHEYRNFSMIRLDPQPRLRKFRIACRLLGMTVTAL